MPHTEYFTWSSRNYRHNKCKDYRRWLAIYLHYRHPLKSLRVEWVFWIQKPLPVTPHQTGSKAWWLLAWAILLSGTGLGLQELYHKENMYGGSFFEQRAAGNSSLLTDRISTSSWTILKTTNPFSANSFEITTQNQIDTSIVVLKFPYKNIPLYLYQQEILQWQHDFNNQSYN